MSNHSLIDVDDSLLIIVDVQDNFTKKLAPEQVQPFIERICWLSEVAGWCGVPRMVTVEDLPKAGGPSQEIIQGLPADVPIFNKLVFGLAGQPDILEAVERTGRKTVILVGLETDVCIMQSALGLMSRSYRPVVISDATGSPGKSHKSGLRRIREAGVLVTDTKGLFYEWMRTLERVRRFEKECAALKVPRNLVL